MTNNEIVFPILELTDWVFEGEKVLDVQYDWSKIHYIKENDFEKQYQRILVDSQGQILKVTGRKIIGKKGYLLSFIIPVTLIVEFELELTGREMTLDEVKRNVIFKSTKNWHLTHEKLMTEKEYTTKVNSAKSFEELFLIAGFEE